MEYPKNWAAEVTAWDEETAPEADILIVKDENGDIKAHKVKGINWLATAAANWKKLTAGILTAVAVVSAVIVAVRLLTGKKD